MNHEKIIVKENGDKLKICVSCWIDMLRGCQYNLSIWTLSKGKRKWKHYSPEDDNYKYRSLTMNQRRDFYLYMANEIAGEENIKEAKLELWNKLKPE